MQQCCVRLSVCRLWRHVLWLNGASYSKSCYSEPIGSIWEIDWYQNEWPWPLFRGRVKVMSSIALHSTLNISKTVTDRGLYWFQRTTNRKWHMGYQIQMVRWPMTSRDLENSWPQYFYSAVSRKRLDLETPFQRTTNRQWHMGYQNNGYATEDVMWPLKVLWGSTVGYPSDSLASCSFTDWLTDWFIHLLINYLFIIFICICIYFIL